MVGKGGRRDKGDLIEGIEEVENAFTSGPRMK